MEQKEKQTLHSKLVVFIEKSRFALIFTLLALIVIAVVAGIFVYVGESKVSSGLSDLDVIEFTYENLDSSSDTYDVDRDALIENASDLAQKSSGIVAVRSYLFVADAYYSLKNWTEAREAFIMAYEADKEAYTAPIALYNAAVASEELGEIDTSIEYLTMSTEYDDFSLKARALFNLGRINESLGNFQEAFTTYQEVNDSYPSTTWANLAKSRSIILTAEGKAE